MADTPADNSAENGAAEQQPSEGAPVAQVGDPVVSPDQGAGQQTEVDADPAGDDPAETHSDDPSAPYGRDATGAALAPYGYLKDGTTPARKRGRKAASVSEERDKQRARLRSVTQAPPRAQKPAPIASPALAVVNYQAMGEAVASMWFSTGEMILGPEWAPDTAGGEHLAVAHAFRDYFKANNYRDLPPGFALCFVLSVYTLKRATKPTIKSKLAGFAAWAKSKVKFLR